MGVYISLTREKSPMSDHGLGAAKKHKFTQAEVAAQAEKLFGPPKAGWDWSKFAALLMKLLPLILPFFMSLQPDEEGKKRAKWVFNLVKAKAEPRPHLMAGAKTDAFIHAFFAEVNKLITESVPAALEFVEGKLEEAIKPFTAMLP